MLRHIFSEDKMVVVYRFALEIEKAQRSLDLNIFPPADDGDMNNDMNDAAVVP